MARDRVTGLEELARLCAISPKARVIVITAREDLVVRATAMAISPVAYSVPTAQTVPGEAYNATTPPQYNPNQVSQ